MVRSLVARSRGYSLLIQRPATDVSYEGLPLRLPPARTAGAHADDRHRSGPWHAPHPPGAVVRRPLRRAAGLSAPSRTSRRSNTTADGSASGASDAVVTTGAVAYHRHRVTQPSGHPQRRRAEVHHTAAVDVEVGLDLDHGVGAFELGARAHLDRVRGGTQPTVERRSAARSLAIGFAFGDASEPIVVVRRRRCLIR